MALHNPAEDRKRLVLKKKNPGRNRLVLTMKSKTSKSDKKKQKDALELKLRNGGPIEFA